MARQEFKDDVNNGNGDENENDTSDSSDGSILGETKVDSKQLNHSLFVSLPDIAHKFDALFPFYRLSDSDCRKLSLFVYNEIYFIEKIFCNSKGRILRAKVYYYGSKVPKNLFFYNNKDSDNEVSQWKDITMNEKYCLQELNNII